VLLLWFLVVVVVMVCIFPDGSKAFSLLAGFTFLIFHVSDEYSVQYFKSAWPLLREWVAHPVSIPSLKTQNTKK
jgi:hypothetical protein